MSDFDFYTPDELEPEPEQRKSWPDEPVYMQQPVYSPSVEPEPDSITSWARHHWKGIMVVTVALGYLLTFTAIRDNLALIFSLASEDAKGGDKKSNKIKEIELKPGKGANRAGLFSFGPSASVTGDYQEEIERALLKAVTVKGTLKRGERVIKAMSRNGLSRREAERIIAAFESRGVFHFRRAQPGNSFLIRMSPEGDRAYYVEYHFGPRITLVASRKRGGFDVRRVVKPMSTRLLGVVMVITRGGLAAAARQADQDPALASKLGVLIEDEIPLTRLSAGDRFEFLVERTYIGGKPSGYGRILAAYIHTRVKGDYEIFYFVQKGEGGGYYTADGLGFFRVFLDRPVDGEVPADADPYHSDGVIFPAGRGAVVKSVGRGRVKWIGWKKTRGRMVVIEHPAGYETAYYYLSRTAHLKVGDSVEKRTVLGRAGAPVMNPALTGAGFSARHGGRYMTPLELAKIREKSMEPVNFPAFRQAVAAYRTYLDPLRKKSASSWQRIKSPHIPGVKPWDRVKKSRGRRRSARPR